MSPKSATPRHSIDSCLFQLHSWKPFSAPTKPTDPTDPTKPNTGGAHSKRPCLSDRATSLFSLSIDHIDFSKLSLFDDTSETKSRREKFRWTMAKKRRRRAAGGSRSVSGRSSDRRGKCCGCCSVGATATATATATCSDFMGVGNGGTDSSGELFHGGGNGWGSDVSEAKNGVGEMSMGVGYGYGFLSGCDGQGSESGYGSEPGYRGDVEFGYGGDEGDDEEEDGSGGGKGLLWGDSFGESNMEVVGENTFSEQKAHHRGRRKKHDWRMVNSVR